MKAVNYYQYEYVYITIFSKQNIQGKHDNIIKSIYTTSSFFEFSSIFPSLTFCQYQSEI